VANAFDGLGELDVEFYRGWKDDLSLAEVMDAQMQKDISLGTTSQGAHKADAKVRVNGQLAADSLSRGQIKLLVYALKLAQATHYQEKTAESCVFLLDDLPAELDYHHRQQVIDCLIGLRCQFFVTGVDKGDFAGLVNNCEHAMFHVEHGVVKSN
jgi:DNA replication and repair protein RecF